MIITKEFKKALYGLFIASFILFGLGIFLEFKQLLYRPQWNFSWLNILVQQIYFLIGSFAFWYAVGFITKDMRSALIAFAIKFIGNVILFFIYSKSKGSAVPQDYWYVTLSFLLSFLAFGILHFRSLKGLWMFITFVVLKGFQFSGGSYDYFELFERLLRFVDLRDALSIHISTGEHTFRVINVLQNISLQFQLPLSFLLFLFIYNRIKSSKKPDFSLRTVEISKKFDWISFSMIYWVFRLVLIASVFGMLYYMRFFLREFGLSTAMILNLLSYFVAIFIAASVYRNIVTSYFVSKGRYPSWLYLFLNIPVINLIAWIVTISVSPRNFTLSKNKIIQNEDKKTNSVEVLKKEFVTLSRNGSIKAVILIFMILSFILKVSSSISGLGLSDGIGQIEYIVFALISFVLTVWYLSDKKALFILFGLQSLSILVTLILNNTDLMVVASTAGLINIFFYYSVFHFDALKFVKEDDKFLDD